MRSRSKGHAAVGVVSALLGAGAIAVGLMRVGPLAGTFLETPAWALAVTGGSVLLLAGGCVLIFSFRPIEEEPNVVPAHVAFNSRMNVPSAATMVPSKPRPVTAAAPRAPARTAAPVAAVDEDEEEEEEAPPARPAPSSRLPSPSAPAAQRVAPLKDDIAGMDAQIRELSRRINKAGVMLATGQLSQQGYLAYVEDLKRQRGQLEANKVKAELRST